VQVQFILTGLLVGTLIGLTGMGGGSLMTPILVLVLGVQPTVAVGTDLAYATLTKVVGGFQHLRQGQVRFGPALWVAVGSVPASLAGTWVVGQIMNHHAAAADRFITRTLAVTLLLVAVLLIVQPWLRGQLWPQDPPPALHPRLRALRRIRPALLIVVGLIIGFLVGVTSVGGGSLVMVALLLFFPRWPMNRRVGTDVFQGCIVSASAALAHLQLHTVSFPLAGQLLIGSIPGVLIGTRLTKVVPERILRPAVASVLTVSAWRLML
jgi:uncharacterized membrane protein YfcA